jgi:hypothetical protein
MNSDIEPVSPITMDDHISPATVRSPEISEQGGEHNAYGDVTKNEHSTYDMPRPKQTNTGLSWRTRLVGRPTVNVDEVENGDYFPPPSPPHCYRLISSSSYN